MKEGECDSFVCARRSTANTFFTITAEIHARLLVNFYGQYADRHMNLKFMSVFNAPVLLLTMDFVITLSK